MQYQWDKKYIKNLAKENPYAKENLYYLINYLKDPIGFSGFTFCSPRKGLILDYNFFKTQPDIYDLTDLFVSHNRIKNDTTYTSSLTTEDALTLTHDFYQSQDKEIYEHFLRHWNKRNDHLQISRKKIFNDYCGEAFCNPQTEDYFAYISQNEGIEMSRIYVHESGHMISKALHYQSNHFKKLQIVAPNEIESIFMEMIFLDYLDQFPELKNDSQIIRQQTYNKIIGFSYDLYFSYKTNKIFKDFFLDSSVTFMDAAKKAAAELEIPLHRFIINLQMPGAFSYKYFLSDVYALALYDLYQKDSQKALSVYKNICRLTSPDTPKKMEDIKKLGINPATNFGDFARKLKR